MRLKLIASLLALCLIFSIGSALANTGTKDCEKTSGAMPDKMNGMSGMGCGKMAGDMAEGKMAGDMTEGKMAGDMTEGKMGPDMTEGEMVGDMTGDMTEGKMAGAMTDKMNETMEGSETGSKGC